MGSSRIATRSLVAMLLVATSASRIQSQGADSTHTSVHPALGLRVGEPQQASAALGVLIGSRWQSAGREHERDAAIFVEPGLSAGRLSAAFVAFPRGEFGSGGGLALSALRTWRNPWGVKPNVSYVGGEAFVWPLVFIGPRLGVFHSVSMGNANRWLFTFDLGIGL